jgi:hypothetical protein
MPSLCFWQLERQAELLIDRCFIQGELRRFISLSAGFVVGHRAAAL